MEYRILELLKDIKNDLNRQPKEDKWLDISQASNYTNLSKKYEMIEKFVKFLKKIVQMQ